MYIVVILKVHHYVLFKLFIVFRHGEEYIKTYQNFQRGGKFPILVTSDCKLEFLQHVDLSVFPEKRNATQSFGHHTIFLIHDNL